MKNKMRKFLVWALTLAFTLSLTACGGAAGESDSTDTDAASTGEDAEVDSTGEAVGADTKVFLRFLWEAWATMDTMILPMLAQCGRRKNLESSWMYMNQPPLPKLRHR